MTYQTINPDTNELVQTWPDHSDAQVEAALTAAHQRYNADWMRGPAQPRLLVLDKLANTFESGLEVLARTITLEMGKLLAESRAEIRIAAQIARYYANHAQRLPTADAAEADLAGASIGLDPAGVQLAVESGHFPFSRLMQVLAPNLAAGNPVIAKHASFVPHCASLFEELVIDAGAPQGAWTNLFVTPDQVDRLISDPRVRGVTMTGSKQASRAIAAAAERNLKKLTLKMDGNDVFVVLEDSDLDHAVDIGTFPCRHAAGQEGVGAKRFIVREEVADAFLQKLAASFRTIRLGNPLHDTTTLGPLPSIRARDNLSRQVQTAIANGAKLHYGGHAVDRPGAFFAPTILLPANRGVSTDFDEFFAQLALVYVVKRDDEAVDLANDFPSTRAVRRLRFF